MTNPTHIDRRGFVGLCAAGALAAGLPRAAAAAGSLRTVAFADGTRVPALAQGSWHMASNGAAPEAAEDAMRLGITLGLTLIDTSDNYSDGRAEQMVAKVIAGRRDQIFLVSKLSPPDATEDGVERELKTSLQRLGTDHLDLYLLHQRGPADLRAAVKGFERVRAKGLVKRWGVSNFETADMEQLVAIPGGEHCATNQVQYNLASRGIEADLVPWCAKHEMPIMAYSPLGAGGKAALLSNRVLMRLGAARGVSAAAIALAWVMRDGRAIAITETASAKHIREDAAALSLTLSAEEIKALDAAFPQTRAG